MKKTIMSMAIVSTLFAGTVGLSSVLAATLDDSSDKVVTNQNVSIPSSQSLLVDLADSKTKSPDLVKGLLVAQGTTKKEATKTKAEEVKQAPTVATYTVASGDTIENIAKAFEVSTEDVLKWNEGMTTDSIIKVGQELKIQTEKDPSKVETTKLTWEKPVVKAEPVAAPVVKEAESTEAVAAEPVATTEPVVEATPVVETAPAAPVAEAATPAPTATTGRTITVSSTAYSYSQPGLSPFTATGIDLRQNSNVIAVDPSVIPLGSRVMVEGYGEAIAGDTGGDIVGNRIDVHFSTVAACYQWGSRSIQVTILD